MPTSVLPPVHDLLGMFLLGLLGTGHCLGMCGPIAIAISPAVGGSRRLAVSLLYNVGRVTTYTALAALVAGMGGTAEALGGVVRVQIGLTVIAGALLIWFALGMLGIVRAPLAVDSSKGFRLPGASGLLKRLTRGGGTMAALPLGVLLGFLPCGLSMAAISRAVSAGHALTGAALVAAFGAGTLPSMITVMWAGAWMTASRRRLAEIIAALLLLAMGVQQLSRLASHLLG